MLPFSAERAGRRGPKAVLVSLGAPERELLLRLLEELQELLDDGSSDTPVDPLAELTGMSGVEGPVAPPEDPALARLLPDGNRDDPELAQEYRRLTEFGLRARKRSAAATAAEALHRSAPVVLAPDEAQCLLKSMTDLRLVFGERLHLKTDEDAEALHQRLMGWGDEPETEEWLSAAAQYELLTVWQEYLVEAVSQAR
ncbi:DUF2017 family protein [Spongisporangium articulatum]|uniref:DUF2017 family protein n=1 Tax=Spongisporangium articulatum TaxID=3362603 RepID=A0ABW8AK76_9ACTN